MSVARRLNIYPQMGRRGRRSRRTRPKSSAERVPDEAALGKFFAAIEVALKRVQAIRAEIARHESRTSQAA
jgi:hypothetical protein